MAFKAAGYRRSSGAARTSRRSASTPQTGKTLVRVNPKFYRPAEVDLLIGDPAKAKAQSWAGRRKTTLEQLCQMMVEADLRRNEHGFSF